MAISVGVTALITGAIYGLNKLASRQGDIAEKAIDSYEKANDKLSDTKTKIEKVNSLIEEYNNLVSKSNNTNKDTTLNNNGRKEALEIQNQIVDLIGSEANKYDLVNGKLEDRLKSLKEINKELGKENVENSVNAMNKSINAKNKAVVGEKASIFGLLTDTGGYNRVYNGYADKTLINELKTNNVKYSYANSYFGAGAGSGVWTNDIKIDLDKNDTAEEKLSKLNEIKSAFELAKTKTKKQKYKDKYQKAIDSIDNEINKIDDLVVKSSKQKANAISDLINYNVNTNDKFSNKKLINATEYENYRNKLADEIKNNKDIKSAVDKKEISTKDIYKQIDDYMSSVDEFSRGYSEWILHQDVEGLDKTKEIKNSFKKNKKGYTKEINSFNKWVNKLNSKEIDYVYQISLDTESAEYNLEEWQNKLLNAKNGSLEDKASIEDFYGIFGNTDDDSFTSKIQKYEDELNSLQDTLSKFKSGELTDNDLTDLILRYPQLINYTNNLDDGINKLIDSITGSAKDGTGIMGEFNNQIEILGENSAGGKKMAELRDRIIEASNAAKDGIKIDISVETQNYDMISNAIKESTSGSGLSTQSINAITNTFKDIKGFDESKIFEKTSYGIRLNIEELENLQNQYVKTNRAVSENKLNKLVNEYNDLTKQINSCTDAKKRSELIDNQNKIREEINSVSKLITQYDGLTSSYLRYLRAKETPNEGAIYDTIYSEKDAIKELYKNGWTGTDDFKEYVRLISNKNLTNASNQDFVKAYKEALPKLDRYSTESNIGLQNLLVDINKKKSNYVSKDKNGGWIINIKDANDYKEIANSIGVSSKFIEASFIKLRDAGFKVKFNGITDELNLVKNNLDMCIEKANTAAGTSYEFDFSTTNLDELDTQISNANDMLNKFRDENTGVIDLTINGAAEAKNVLKTLVEQKQQLTNTNVDSMSKLLEERKKSVEEFENEFGVGFVDEANLILESLIKIKNLSDKIDLGNILGEDTTDLEIKLQKEIENFSELNPEIKAELGIDETSVKSIVNSITNLDPEILAKFEVDSSKVDNYTKKNHDIDATVKYRVDETIVRKYQTKTGQKVTITKDKNTGITTRTTTNKDGSKITESTQADGSARTFANGSAFAQGNWGLKNSGTALVGELAPELLVRDGKWKLIGENGAEFIKYKQNDIIFNGKQTQEILKYGKIINGKSRGRALNSGTAFGDGKNNYTNGANTTKASGSFTQISKANAKTDSQKDKDKDKNKNKNKNKTQKADKDTKTALEKFQDWFSRLFDWIEIKLQKQTDRINKYVTTAEKKSEVGNYSSAISNYKSAIKSTNTQITYEKQASDKYTKQANSILKKAVSMGVINQKTANGIATKVANGSMNISEYSDSVREIISAYKEFADKADEAKNSIQELHYNIREYIKDIKEVADAQRELSLTKIDNRINAIQYDAYSSSGKNNLLYYNNGLINDKNKIYHNETLLMDKEVNYSKKNSVAYTANKSLSSASKVKITNKKKRDEYKKSLAKAQTCIKSKQKIPTATLDLIGKYSSTTYQYCYAYNLALENLQVARQEQVLNFVSNTQELFNNYAEVYKNNEESLNNQIELLQKQSNNATTVNKKNSYLNNVIEKQNTLLDNNNNEVKKYNDLLNNSKKKINIKDYKNKHTTNTYRKSDKAIKSKVDKTLTSVVNQVKSGKEITPTNMNALYSYYINGYINKSFYESCVTYNNALAEKQRASYEAAINAETIKSEKAAIGTQKLENIKQDYQNKLDDIEGEKSRLSSSQAIKTTKGGTLTERDYTNLLNQEKQKQTLYKNMITDVERQINQNIKDKIWTTTSQEYIDAKKSITDMKVEMNNCINTQQEYNNALQTMDLTRLEKAVDLLSSYQNYLQSIVDLTNAQDGDVSVVDYQKQVDNNLEQIVKEQEKANSAWNKYLLAVADADNAYAGKSADEWKSYYYETLSSINSLKRSNEELYDNIWQTYVKPFEEAIDKFKDYVSLIESTNNLLNSNNFTDKNGGFTSQGLAQISNYLKMLDGYKNGIKEYENAISTLNRMYNNGTSGLSEKEYNDKLKEYKNGLMEIASSEKSVIDNLVGMWSDAAKVELDNLTKIVNKRKDALQSKKGCVKMPVFI